AGSGGRHRLERGQRPLLQPDPRTGRERLPVGARPGARAEGGAPRLCVGYGRQDELAPTVAVEDDEEAVVLLHAAALVQLLERGAAQQHPERAGGGVVPLVLAQLATVRVPPRHVLARLLVGAAGQEDGQAG